MATAQNTGAFWSETWSLAMQALRANKMRAVLTMLGVIIGSGSIVLVVTIALGGQRYVLSQIEGIGANLVSARVVNPGDGGTLAVEDQISPGDLQAVSPNPFLLSYGVVGPDNRIEVSLRWDHRVTDAVVAARALKRLEQVLNTEISTEIAACGAQQAGP